MIKVLFFGDIMGKPGRQTLAQVLPSIRAEFEPNLVVANVENLAHGNACWPKMGKIDPKWVEIAQTSAH